MTSNLAPQSQSRTRTGRPALGDAALLLGIAGLLPILPVLGSVAALVCGGLALSEAEPGERAPARAGLVLGAVGLAAPLVFLFVYCVVLGYPFPIHRYAGR